MCCAFIWDINKEYITRIIKTVVVIIKYVQELQYTDYIYTQYIIAHFIRPPVPLLAWS